MINLTIIAGARPNFMKVAPIIHEILKTKEISYRLVHTGQHYDHKMSGSFFEALDIPKPDINLECGGGTQAEQTAAIMVAFEKELIANPADYVLVVGDVTSTMACSIVAKKLNTKVIHVEAGIRSDDLTMPEEINRMVTDSVTDVFFTTTSEAAQKLIDLGHSSDRIHWVGNVMIDTLLKQMPRFKEPECWNDLCLENKKYFVMTMHRPANVDEQDKLEKFMVEISKNAGDYKVVFPIHPRTLKIFKEADISFQNIIPIDPLGYLEFNYLVQHAAGVLTDSGGITEETTVMGIPCITLRDNTERPETVTIGTNELIGTNPERIGPAITKIIQGNWKKGETIEKWDGKAAERIINQLKTL